MRYFIDEAKVRAALIPPQTITYKPVSHGSIIDVTKQAILDNGFTIFRESYMANYGALIVIGCYDLKFNNDMELGIRICWQNSYNKEVAFKYVIGANAWICSNGMFAGDMGMYKKKHMGEIQTLAPEKVKEYVSSAGEVYHLMNQDKQLMLSTPCSTETQAELAGRLYILEKILGVNQLTYLKKEIHSPTFIHEEGTMWQFYNNVTQVLKNASPRLYFEKHQKFHDFIMNLI